METLQQPLPGAPGSYEIVETVDDADAEYIPIVENPNLADDDDSDSMRESRRCFGKITQKLQEKFKEVQLKLESRLGATDAAKIPNSSSSAVMPLDQLLDRIRVGNDKLPSSEPSVGKAMPILQPIELPQIFQPAKLPNGPNVDKPTSIFAPIELSGKIQPPKLSNGLNIAEHTSIFSPIESPEKTRPAKLPNGPKLGKSKSIFQPIELPAKLPSGPNVGKPKSIFQSIELPEKIWPAKLPKIKLPAVTNPVKAETIEEAVPNAPAAVPHYEVNGPAGNLAAETDKMVGMAKKPGPIVQPTLFFEEEDVKKKPKKKPHTTTKQQLKAAKQARDEINFAVQHHQYAHADDEIRHIYESEHHEHHHHHHHRNGTKLQFDPLSLFASIKAGDSLPSIVGSQRADFPFIPGENGAAISPAELPIPQSLLNSTLPEFDRRIEEVVDEMMAENVSTIASPEIIANVIESHALDGDEAGTDDEQSFVNSDLREVLHIKAITEDMQFNLGNKVISWKTIQRNAHDKHALVGLTATAVILLVERNGTYFVQAEVPLLSTPSCMTTYTRWNRTQNVIEGIVIVATRSELVFLRVSEELDTMRLYWIVQMNTHTVSAIEYFAINDAHLVVLVSVDMNPPSANLYRFALDHRELYLRDSFALAVPAKTVSYFTTGSEHFLTFPQRKAAVVYKFANDRFKYFAALDAENIETLEAFEMGGNSYLALGGTRPRILRYFRGEFHDQTILAPSWGQVEHFLPIPARTYRDDLIVLIQHRIDFATHNISVLEALIWNGEAFDPALSIPCIVNGRKSEHGLGCIMDMDRELGIQGATVLQRNNLITILSPRHEAPSGLFDLEFELRPAAFQYDELIIDLFSEILVMLDARSHQVTDARQTYDEFETSRNEEIVIADRAFDAISTNYAEWDDEIAQETKLFHGNEPTDAQTITNFILAVDQKQSRMTSEPPRSKRDDNVVEWRSLNVSNLFIDSINNVSVADFVFLRNNLLELHGTLVLQQALDFDEVQLRDDKLAPHNALLNKEMPLEAREDANEQAIESAVERLDVNGDFAFEEINGLLWQELIDEIVLKNQPQDLSELVVNGVGVLLLFDIVAPILTSIEFGILGIDCRR